LSALRTGRPLHPGNLFHSFLVLISVRGRVDPRTIAKLGGLGKLKKKSASSGLEPATFQLVAWCLNQLCYRVPPSQLLRKDYYRVHENQTLNHILGQYNPVHIHYLYDPFYYYRLTCALEPQAMSSLQSFWLKSCIYFSSARSRP
jgi:hypothetical protein